MFVSGGAVILRDHINSVCGATATMYWRGQGMWLFIEKLDSKHSGEHPKEAKIEASLTRGEDLGLSIELPDQPSCGLFLCGALTRIRGKLTSFSIKY